MTWQKTFIICLLIFLAGSGIMMTIFFTEPTAEREGATRKTAMLVEVTGVERGSFRPVIVAMGTVAAEQDIILSSQVRGELIERASVFTPGGKVRKGEILLRIDPVDYRNTLQQQKSLLQEALANLDIEMGRQDVAQKDFQIFEQELSAEKIRLVLRKPQLETAQAQVEAAQAAVQQAELELERTIIKAPFNAQVLSRAIDVGSQIEPGQSLGRLVGLDTYWVIASVPLSKLHMISYADETDQKGSKVKIYNRVGWKEDQWRSGHVVNLIGALEEQTRMARVLVVVPDPLATRPDNANKPTMMLGAYVEAHIEANEIHDVLRLNRDYIRSGDTVWVNDNGKLAIREVEIVFQDAKYAYIKHGLDETDQVVTTNLRTITEGVELRVGGRLGKPEKEQDDDRPGGRG